MIKVQIIKNGSIKLVLIPTEGDDVELSSLKDLAKTDVEVTFIEGQTPFLDGHIHNVLIIKPKTK